MIKHNGLQVIPSELEALLLERPDVDDATVVSQWVEKRATEVPVAFMVLGKEGSSKRDPATVTNCNSLLAQPWNSKSQTAPRRTSVCRCDSQECKWKDPEKGTPRHASEQREAESTDFIGFSYMLRVMSVCKSWL